MQRLDDLQRAAVQADTNTPLLVLAGPGSGKTTVFVERIKHIKQQHSHELSHASRILAISFSKSASREVAERLFACGASEFVHTCTYHALANSAVREHYLKLGYTNVPKVCSNKEVKRMLMEILGNNALEYKRLFRSSTSGKRVGNLVSFIDQQVEQEQQEYVDLKRRLYTQMETECFITFDDMILKVISFTHTHTHTHTHQ